MEFLYSRGNAILTNKIIFDKTEETFYMYKDVETNFSVMLGCAYLGMDINLIDMQVYGVSGLCPTNMWVKKELKMPQNVISGRVKINEDKELKAGMGIYIVEKTPIYFDEKNNWICIGKHNSLEYTDSIKFVDNAFICLNGNEFKALWINIINNE